MSYMMLKIVSLQPGSKHSKFEFESVLLPLNLLIRLQRRFKIGAAEYCKDSKQVLSAVCYHVDQCTKNKCMIWISTIWISTHGLFLTCTKSPFLVNAHGIKNKCGCVMLKEKILYLERQSPVHGGEFPSSQIPCLKSTAFMPLALPSPRQPHPAKWTFVYTQTTTLTCPLLLSGTVGYSADS